MEKAYDHKKFEDEIYKKWETSGAFTPKIDESKKPFVISMPPPNVTGKLHIGHALGTTLEDIMIRYNRMKGVPSLWIPGTDHAGIATQNVVEKQLSKEGMRRHDLGREKFVERVWKWKEEYGSTITSQMRKIGASCDWTRERFTLDEGLSEAVNEAFVKFYEKGLIYQGLRTINWCPRCQTAIADDEVEYKKEIGKFYWLKYGPFTLATARPETKLGDTAVAVHPKDPRYKDMVGKKYKIPGVLGEFEIVVVADNAVDPAFGSGAVKVTPAHSLVDFEIAQRHGIAMKQVIDESGRMMENTKKYAGMKTKEAREAIVVDMKKLGLIEKIDEPYEHNVATCYRCNGSIEPLPSKQWFVKMTPLAEKAKKAVESGDIKIMPKRFEKVYFHWLDNIRDWCISRQLWWGHRIPVWHRNSKLKVKSEKLKVKVMGFADRVVPQIYKGKIKTYRVRDHELKDRDKVYFENSQTGKIFGYGIISQSEQRKVKDLPLQDKAHGAVYEKLEVLISAFKLYNPEKEITPESDAWIYGYEFVPKEKFNESDLAVIPDSRLNDISRRVIRNLDSRSPIGVEDRFRGNDKEETIGNDSEIYVGIKPPKDSENWVQDEDVLDTWFSSGLWPFSTLGWSEEKQGVGSKGFGVSDYEYFFPTTVMETGYDILFFWVARMIMMSLELTGKAPFKTVYLHGLVRDEQNRKMSKSLGNIIDPLDVIEKYGADALRFSLVVGATAGKDLAMGESKIKGYRNFSNKIWNISRFVITNLENSMGIIPGADPESRSPIPHPVRLCSGPECNRRQVRDKLSKNFASDSRMTDQDKADLAKLKEVEKKVTKLLDELKFSQAGEVLYDYTWHEFADKIIEQEKKRLYLPAGQASGEDEKDKKASLLKLTKMLTATLKLLHPYMPYVTEAVWDQFPEEAKDSKLLISSSWPS